MRKINFNTLMAATLTVISVLLIFIVLAIDLGKRSAGSDRDLDYENYLDSVRVNDPDYFYDVILESDEYWDYLDKIDR